MSQVDRLVYIPLLFWFVILLLLLYFVVYSYFLPLFFTSFKVRRLFFFYLINWNTLSLLNLRLFYSLFWGFTWAYFYVFLQSLAAVLLPLEISTQLRSNNS